MEATCLCTQTAKQSWCSKLAGRQAKSLAASANILDCTHTHKLLLLVLKIALNTVWETKWAAYNNRTRCSRVAVRQAKSLSESGNIIDDDLHPTSSSFRLENYSLSLSL